MNTGKEPGYSSGRMCTSQPKKEIRSFLGSLDVLHQSLKRKGKNQFFIVIAEALLFDCSLCFSLIDVLEDELDWMRH